MKLLTATILILLSGCAQFSSVKGGVVDQAAAVSDEALATSEFMLCRGITVGSWMRAYGNDPIKAAAWRAICAQPITQTPGKLQ